MAFDGNGVYSLPANSFAVPVTDTVIASADATTTWADFETAFNLCVVNNQTVSPTLISPIVNEVLDTNSNENLTFVTTGSAVNNVRIANAATGNAAKIDVTETNTDLELAGNGTGGVTISSLVNMSAGGYGTVIEHASSPFDCSAGTETAIPVTGIPSWVKRIHISFNIISTDGTADYFLQLGDSGGIETSNYRSECVELPNAAANASVNSAAAYILTSTPTAAGTHSGEITLTLVNSPTNQWASSGILKGPSMLLMAGDNNLTGTLTQFRLTTSNGTDVFDSGEFSVHYEG